MESLQKHFDGNLVRDDDNGLKEKVDTNEKVKGIHIDVSQTYDGGTKVPKSKETEGFKLGDNISETNIDGGKDSHHSCLENGNPSDEMEKAFEKNDARDSLTVNDVCPFVCGICSDKFDKVSAFYAHLKTHDNFDIISQMNKKDKILEALNVQDKVNENVFKCGICKIAFPSMSLLHEHMVAEENMPDYNYSNADHTARPDSNITLSNSMSHYKPEKFESITDTSHIRKGKRKRKADEVITIESLEATIIKNLSDANTDTKNEKVIRKKILENQEKEVDKTTVTSGSSRDLTPVIRSSKRLSARGPQKRVDYKALAGYGSANYDSDENTEKSPRKQDSVISYKKKRLDDEINNIEENEDVVDNSKVEINISEVELEANEEINPTMHKDKLTSNIKLVSGESSGRGKDSDNISEDFVKEKIETEDNSDSASQDSENFENEAIESEDEKEAIEIEPLKGSTKEKFAVKADGTYVDADSDSENNYKYEDYSDYEKNASADDSDDDFIEENDYEDDEIKDPNFVLKSVSKNEDNDDDDVVESYIETSNPEEYLKKFNGKKKSVTRNRNGRQPLKNCLYPCAICGRYYLWKALKKHMYAHVKAKVVECSQCGKKYKSERHLKDHIRSVHAMKKFRCPKCNSILKGNQSFCKHVTMHILKKEITVALDEVVKIEVSEEEYIKWKGQQESATGDNNSKKKKEDKVQKESERQSKEDVIELDLLKDGPLYGQHVELKADVIGTCKNQFCKICKRNFPTHESLVQHVLEHNEEKQYSCSICKGFFQTQEHLESHMVNVHGERDIACDICGEKLRSTYALWTHKGKHLMKKDKYYSEEIVQKLQEEIAQRKARKKSRSLKDSSQKCEICGMVVLSVRYKRHLEVHNTTKDWQCEICHNYYKTRRYLIDHLKKTHNAEKIPCDICGLKFKGKTYLEIHKQTHGPKDKHCTVCGKGFTTLMYLKTHQLTHEEKKRFRCDQCMAAFSHKQRLAIHMVEVHGEGASRPCKYCGDLFPSRQKARRHERVMHEGYSVPHKIKKHPKYYNVVSVDEYESLGKKIMKLMPDISGFVTVPQGMIKVPASTNVQDTELIENVAIPATENVNTSDINNDGQLIKLENGEEYKVMIEKEGTEDSLEFVELTEEEQNVIIQEADGVISQEEPLTVEQSDNVEQILEIPENAEQCQILLYPDGTFKLLNVVDKPNLS